MHKELLVQSPLLVLPLVAMFLFLAVWVIAAIRVLTQSRDDIVAAARLPLESDGPSPGAIDVCSGTPGGRYE